MFVPDRLKLPLRKVERWYIGVSSLLIAVAITVMNLNSSSITAYSSTTTAPRSYSSSAPFTTNAAELKSLRERIESGRSQMVEIENRLRPVMDEASSIEEQMKPLRYDLEFLKREQREGIAIDTDHYNSLAGDYNSMLRRKKTLIESRGTEIDTYESLKKEDESMMEQWKALGGKIE